jgi:hypothetical protein
VRTFETEETFHAPRYTRASPYPRHHSRDFEDEDKEEQQLRERRNARGKNDEERFLDVDLPEGVLNLGSVVLRDVHVLRKFDVVNRSPSSPLHLTLASTLPDEQVGFQLTNAKLQGELEEEDHNQLFNTINRINELTLGPLERKSIILSFLPINQIPDADAHREVCTTRSCLLLILIFTLYPSGRRRGGARYSHLLHGQGRDHHHCSATQGRCTTSDRTSYTFRAAAVAPQPAVSALTAFSASVAY